MMTQRAGLGGRTGAITPGLEADLIVVDRDPLADLRALDRPSLVVNSGRIAFNSSRRNSLAWRQPR